MARSCNCPKCLNPNPDHSHLLICGLLFSFGFSIYFVFYKKRFVSGRVENQTWNQVRPMWYQTPQKKKKKKNEIISYNPTWHEKRKKKKRLTEQPTSSKTVEIRKENCRRKLESENGSIEFDWAEGIEWTTRVGIHSSFYGSSSYAEESFLQACRSSI